MKKNGPDDQLLYDVAMMICTSPNGPQYAGNKTYTRLVNRIGPLIRRTFGTPEHNAALLRAKEMVDGLGQFGELEHAIMEQDKKIAALEAELETYQRSEANLRQTNAALTNDNARAKRVINMLIGEMLG